MTIFGRVSLCASGDDAQLYRLFEQISVSTSGDEILNSFGHQTNGD
jgi:hypothetical protein